VLAGWVLSRLDPPQAEDHARQTATTDPEKNTAEQPHNAARPPDIVAQAADTAEQTKKSAELARVLRVLGEPLELVQFGPAGAQLRLDGQYLKFVRQAASVEGTWQSIDRRLHARHGLPPVVRNLFLVLLCRGLGYDAIKGDRTIRVRLDDKVYEALTLRYAGTRSEQARWAEIRALARRAFGIDLSPRPSLGARAQLKEDILSCISDLDRALRFIFQNLSKITGFENGIPYLDRIKKILEDLAFLESMAKNPEEDMYNVLLKRISWPDMHNKFISTSLDKSYANELEKIQKEISLTNSTERPKYMLFAMVDLGAEDLPSRQQVKDFLEKIVAIKNNQAGSPEKRESMAPQGGTAPSDRANPKPFDYERASFVIERMNPAD
jgi:hypothetical protein